MITSGQQSFSAALKSVSDRKIMPTGLTSAELRAVDASVRQQSFFSARTLLSDLLDGYKEKVGALLNPTTEQRPDRVTETNPEGNVTVGLNEAYARTQMRDLVKSLGYSPDPNDAGTLKDLSSDARIDLVLRTNKQLAQGQGNWIQSQRTGALEAFPADELFRLEDREQKRNWINRWRTAGAQTGDPIGTGWTITPDERMIALKNHAIWNWIGSSDLFDDALDVIWPPFAFNSGMWVRDVSRVECEDIGLLERGDAAPQPMNIVDAMAGFASKVMKMMEGVE